MSKQNVERVSNNIPNSSPNVSQQSPNSLPRVSKQAPEQFPNSSETDPKQFRTSSKTVPKWIRNSSQTRTKAVSNQVQTQSKTNEHNRRWVLICFQFIRTIKSMISKILVSQVQSAQVCVTVWPSLFFRPLPVICSIFIFALLSALK